MGNRLMYLEMAQPSFLGLVFLFKQRSVFGQKVLLKNFSNKHFSSLPEQNTRSIFATDLVPITVREEIPP